MHVAHGAKINVDLAHTLPLKVSDNSLPSEHLGKGIWLWLMVSGPILWAIHGILLGVVFIFGEHFGFPAYLIAILYG